MTANHPHRPPPRPPWPDGSELAYDPDTIAAPRHHEQAARAMEPVRGTPRAYGVFKRYLHYANLIARQHERLHFTHRTTTRGHHCTCGLVVPTTHPDPLTAPGHLDPHTWEPATLLIGSRAPHQPATDPAPDFTDWPWTVCCTSCGWQGSPTPLATARLLAAAHPPCPAATRHQHDPKAHLN